MYVNKSKTSFKDEILVNCVKYHQVKKHITYYLSKHYRVHEHSLAYQGANRGVARDNVRVIYKHTDKTVNVRGIDNHEITSIPLVRAGGVTSTTTSEIIVILN